MTNRRYGEWAGNPNGHPEDPENCIAIVPLKGTYRYQQCSRKRGKGPEGLYCGIHARQIAKGSYVNVPEVKK